jgi:4-diphosphocytidyl-2-C-methyl-D-erythritol kinase
MRCIYNIPAPAKINSFLHVVGQRPDGYHELQSVFLLIDWYDYINFDLRTDGKITREDINTKPRSALPVHDLCVKTAYALQEFTGSTQGVHIGLSKNIPIEAGLGGGSSNAATTLIALNQLWGLSLSKKQLLQVAKPLGADISFFIEGRHAWVEGTGDKLTPLQLPLQTFLLIKPNTGIVTQDVFQHKDLRRSTEIVHISDFMSKIKDDPDKLMTFGNNDLQSVAQQLCPAVKKTLKILQYKGLYGKMTGSGSTIFSLSKMPHTDFKRLKKALPKNYMLRLCNSIERHPLFEWVT